MTHPADWYPDPQRRHELRYYDGTTWTEHVSDGGVTGDRPGATPALDRLDAALTVGNEGDRAKVAAAWSTARERRGAGIVGDVPQGGGTIFDEPILVVNQKAKVIELNNQYRVLDRSGKHDRDGRAARPVDGQEGAAPADQPRPVHDPQAADRRRQRAGAAAAHPPGARCSRARSSSRTATARRSAASCRRTCSARSTSASSPAARARGDQGRELAGVELPHRGCAPAPRSPASRRPSRASPRRCSRRPTTTSCSSTSQPPQPLHTLVVAAALSVDTALKQDARGLG